MKRGSFSDYIRSSLTGCKGHTRERRRIAGGGEIRNRRISERKGAEVQGVRRSVKHETPAKGE